MKRKNTGRVSILVGAALMMAAVFSGCDSSKELEREAEDVKNIKSAYAEIVTHFLDEGDASVSIDVPSQQKAAGWQGEAPTLVYLGGSNSGYPIPACTDAGQTYRVGITVDDNNVAVPNITVR